MKHLWGLGSALALVGLAITTSAQQAAVPRDKPTFNEVYEFCLAAYAGTGVGRQMGGAVVGTCEAAAERSSGETRPAQSSAWTKVYQQCLLGFAVNGAPSGVDLSVYCGRVATQTTGEQPPGKRYVVLQQGGANPGAKPGYNEAFAVCLMGAAVTGSGRSEGAEKVLDRCTTYAQSVSGAPRPTPTAFEAQFQQCLLDFAVNGAPAAGDMAKICTDVATMVTSTPPSDDTRTPR